VLEGGWYSALGVIGRHLFRNDLVSAGLILGVLGTLLAYSRSGISYLYQRIVQYYTVSVSVDSNDSGTFGHVAPEHSLTF